MLNGKIKIVLGLVLVVLLGLLVIFFMFGVSDASKFKREYEAYNGVSLGEGTYLKLDISKDNGIKYLNDDNIVEELSHGSKIIYFGFPDCNWCRMAVPVLLDAASLNGVKDIYYYNFKNVRNDYYLGKDNNGSRVYEEIIKILDKYISVTFEDGKNKGKKRITAPMVVLVNKGKISSVHLGTISSHKDYEKDLTKDERDELFTMYEDMMVELLLCDDECKD